LPAPFARQVEAELRVDPAASPVELGEAFAQGFGGGVLHHRVHRGPHPQPAGIDAVGPVGGLLAIFPEQLAADFLHEIAAGFVDAGTRSVADRAERHCLGLVVLRLADVAVGEHLAQHIVAPVERLLGGALRVVVRRRLGQHREVGGLGQRQVGDVLVEIGAGCGLHTIGVAPEEDRVEVDLKDLGLRQRRLEAEGEDRLADLALDRIFVVAEQMLGDLLGDGRPAACPRAAGGLLDDEIADRADQPGIVDPAMAEEGLVLGRDERLDDQRRIFLERQFDPPLAREAADRVAIITADIGRQRGLVGEQFLRARQAGRKIEIADGEENPERPRRPARPPHPTRGEIGGKAVMHPHGRAGEIGQPIEKRERRSSDGGQADRGKLGHRTARLAANLAGGKREYLRAALEKDLKPQFAMRTKPHELQNIGVRLAINEDEIGPNMAVAMIRPVAGQRVVAIAQCQ